MVKGKEAAEEEKFRDYYAYAEPIKEIPSHRALALFRGRTLGVLSVTLGLGEELEVGNLSVNHLVASVAETPFGGVKDSGYGREGGTEGLACYTIARNVSHLTAKAA